MALRISEAALAMDGIQSLNLGSFRLDKSSGSLVGSGYYILVPIGDVVPG